MAIKYSSVPDSLYSIERGNGIEFKDLDTVHGKAL